MGFDDCVFDSDIEQKTLELCRQFYSYYSPLNLMLDEEWLTSAENEKQYNGYSLAFHLLYTISYTIRVGRCINADKASQKEIDYIKKRTRIKIIKDMIKFYCNNPDDINDGSCEQDIDDQAELEALHKLGVSLMVPKIGEQIDALILYVYKFENELD